MPAVPFLCPSCGLVPHEGILGGSGDFHAITLSRISVLCPQCGRQGQIVSGTYNVVAGVVSLLQSVPGGKRELTIIWRAAQEATARLEADPTDEVAARQAVEEAAPDFASRLWALAGSGQLANALAVLIALLGPMVAGEINVDIDVNIGNSETTVVQPAEPSSPPRAHGLNEQTKQQISDEVARAFAEQMREHRED